MLDFLLSPAFAQAGAPQGPSALFSWGLPVLMVAVFWFALIRPQQKRDRAHRDMLGKLGKGDEVVTTGGVCGVLREIGENYVTVEVSEGVPVKMEKRAIAQVLPKGSLKNL